MSEQERWVRGRLEYYQAMQVTAEQQDAHKSLIDMFEKLLSLFHIDLGGCND
jgi:hypothetical protein